MRDDIIYWLWLQCVFGANNRSFKAGLEYFHTAEEFYNASEYDYKICDCFTHNIIDKLKSKELTRAEKILDDCRRLRYDIITYDDNQFSQKLRSISSPPCVLYVNGKMPNIDDAFSVAVVGSRDATSQGLNAANNFSYSLAGLGTVVISGGALGIDSAAHKGALKAGGITVCVLGCGIDYKYLIENIRMREEIAESGAVISEFPPGYPPVNRNFPLRNRIICGLSDCTLVVQAGEGSGALITANDAIKESRKLFAVPGSIFSEANKGSNNLLRRGFSAAIDSSDLVNWYNLNKHDLNYPIRRSFNELFRENSRINSDVGQSSTEEHEKISSESLDITDEVLNNEIDDGSDVSDNEKKYPADISELSLKVLKTISDIPVTTDYISNKTGIPINALLSALTELEIFGYIESVIGGKYILK